MNCRSRHEVAGRVDSSKRWPASRTATRYPFSVSRSAVVDPPKPLPTTMTSTSLSLPATAAGYGPEPAGSGPGADAAQHRLADLGVGRQRGRASLDPAAGDLAQLGAG